jgi:hypothetical protein
MILMRDENHRTSEAVIPLLDLGEYLAMNISPKQLIPVDTFLFVFRKILSNSHKSLQYIFLSQRHKTFVQDEEPTPLVSAGSAWPPTAINKYCAPFFYFLPYSQNLLTLF